MPAPLRPVKGGHAVLIVIVLVADAV